MSDEPTAPPPTATPPAVPAPEAPAQAAAPVADVPQPATGPDPRSPEGPTGKTYFWGTGRRKRAIARVRLRPGDGTFKVNGREVNEFFCIDKDRQAVVKPLEVTGSRKKLDVFVNVRGGGITGQAGAIVLGVARALKKCNSEYEPALRENKPANA